jgi:hypothetical protein
MTGVILVLPMIHVLVMFGGVVDWLPLHVAGAAAGIFDVLVVVDMFLVPWVGFVFGVGVSRRTGFVVVPGPLFMVSVLSGIRFVRGHGLVTSGTLMFRQRTVGIHTGTVGIGLRL